MKNNLPKIPMSHEFTKFVVKLNWVEHKSFRSVIFFNIELKYVYDNITLLIPIVMCLYALKLKSDWSK